MTHPAFQIRPVVSAELAAAFALLQMPSAAGDADKPDSRPSVGPGEHDLGGLFVAVGEEGLCGAVWLQPQPGRYALLTPPGLAPSAPASAGERLLQRSLEYARQTGVGLVQALLAADAESQAGLLLARGFSELAELTYLVALSQGFPTAAPQTVWSCRKIAPRDLPRLGALIERTYEGSLDCPRLAGLRSTADALAGYAAVGVTGIEHWRLVEYGGAEVGCLLMADHPGEGPRELVYLGLVPEARGRGWGEQLSRFAQWTCRAAGKELLVLAVDAANAPALEAYARAGFTRWETRRVFVQNLDSSSTRPSSSGVM